jgi:hypothetical protein
LFDSDENMSILVFFSIPRIQMTSGPIFSDSQLKLWLRRVETEMAKGTPPEAALDLVKAVMNAQSAGQTQPLPATDLLHKSAKNS